MAGVDETGPFVDAFVRYQTSSRSARMHVLVRGELATCPVWITARRLIYYSHFYVRNITQFIRNAHGRLLCYR